LAEPLFAAEPPAPTFAGRFQVQVSATDGLATVTDEFLVTVT
jgi:hypothetical protein